MAEVLWMGRWMIVTHLLFSLYGRLDVLFLGWLRNGAEVGYYTVAWNLGFLIDLCTYSFITALLPQASRMRDRRDYFDYGRKTLGACALMALAVTPMLLFAEPFIRLLFPAYVPAVEIFRVLFWGSLITLLTHPLYLIVYQRDRVELRGAVQPRACGGRGRGLLAAHPGARAAGGGLRHGDRTGGQRSAGAVAGGERAARALRAGLRADPMSRPPRERP